MNLINIKHTTFKASIVYTGLFIIHNSKTTTLLKLKISHNNYKRSAMEPSGLNNLISIIVLKFEIGPKAKRVAYRADNKPHAAPAWSDQAAVALTILL